jgi:signal transduction histidine kinase
LLTRAGFALRMADRFGRALYEKRPVSVLLGRPPVLADVDAPLNALNALILKSDDGALLEGFIGVRNGVYEGVGTGIAVMRANAEAAMRTAKSLQAERARARSIEASLLDLFRSADALAADKRAMLARKGAVVSAPASNAVPTHLVDLFPHIERLFGEIRARDEALLQALDAAEAASQAKSQFLANTSHELRTPLNAIIGYAELVEEVARDRDDQMLITDAGRIVAAGRRLLRLINDILDMSKIEAGKLQVCVDEFDLAALIRESVALVAGQARTNRTKLRTDIDPAIGHITSDGLRVRQCLLNLLSNAVKFTHDGAVVLRARIADGPIGPLARIEVIDTGVGMSAQELDGLFQPFAQASARTSAKFGGTGLGLAITKRLANALGGDVTATSAPAVGSCFVLALPLQPAHEWECVA